MRFSLGEGIEKKEDDLAAEVAKMTGDVGLTPRERAHAPLRGQRRPRRDPELLPDSRPPRARGPGAPLVYDLAVGRLRDGADARSRSRCSRSAPTSRDARPPSAPRVRRTGYEIANHTLDHRYDLVRLGRNAIRDRSMGGAEAIERRSGAPRGFRAPGYTITDEVFEVLVELGVAYDSSVFPCPAY